MTTSRFGLLAVAFISMQAMAETAWSKSAVMPPAPGAAAPGSIDAMKAKFRRPTSVPHPTDNPPTAAKIELGRALFFDPRLSGSNFIACSTCHNPSFSWGDGLGRAIGHGMKTLGRRSPTILDLAWGSSFFWDGRAETLEQQALGPITAPGEMNLAESLDKKLGAIPGYKPLFAAAFGDPAINNDRVAKAIAAFERTVVSPEAPFDRWINGDTSAIGADAQRGFVLFNTKAGCNACHEGWRFTDDSFHDIGLHTTDKGRGAILEGLESMQHAFKTPTLRNVSLRGPYMHDGSELSLDAVMELYERGGRVRRPSLSTNIKPLQLTPAERRDVIAFLKTLNTTGPVVASPLLPR